MVADQSSTTFRSVKTLVIASWIATKGDRIRFFSFVILYIFAYTLDLAVPWAIGWTIGVYVKQGLTPEAFHTSLWGIGAYIALKMVQAVMHHTARYLQMTSAFNVRFKKLEEIFSALMSFPLKWHVHHHSGENLSRLNRSVGAVETLVGNYVWQIIDGFIKFFFATIAIFALDYYVALCVLFMGCVSVFLMLRFNVQLTRNIRKSNRFNDRLNRTCVDYLYNIITVKTLKLEEPAVHYLTKQREDGFELSKLLAKYQELKWGSIGVGYSLVIGFSLLIYFYTHTRTKGIFDVAQVYVILNYLDRIFGSITQFTGYYSGVIEAATAYDDASSVIIESEELKNPLKPSRVPRNWDTLDLSEIEFSYGGDLLNLKGIALSIQRGEKIALVGPSGGGKSTLLKVLAGMLQVSKTTVKTKGVEGLTIDDVSGVSLLVPQEPEIFSETVRYNLTLGQSFELGELHKALELCRIDYLLEKLPNGWQSNLEEAGLNISVGERQRLALARGVLRIRDKDILLLDEPTSSLDPVTENEIFNGILKEYADRTMIMACHRLALAPLFDRIIYIRDGKIKEQGTFSELKSSGQAFASAWSDFQKNVGAHDGVVLG